MTLQNIRKLSGRRAQILDEEDGRKYAVIAPLITNADGTDCELLFEVRSSKLRRQPGEICFPGGRLEKNEDPLFAALRETTEELLIPSSAIEVIAPLDIMLNSDNTAVFPYVARLHGYDGTFSRDEVEEVFSVPVSFFMENEPAVYYNQVTVNTENPEEVKKLLGADYKWRGARYAELFYLWKNRVIWGMTAKFIHNLVTLCRDNTIENPG